MAKLKRIDGLDWNEVKKLGFKHVDGSIYDVPASEAAMLLKEQPERWAQLTPADKKGASKPKPTPKPKPHSGTITSEGSPELLGGKPSREPGAGSEGDTGADKADDDQVERFVPDDAEVETADKDVLPEEPEVEGAEPDEDDADDDDDEEYDEESE